MIKLVKRVFSIFKMYRKKTIWFVQFNLLRKSQVKSTIPRYNNKQFERILIIVPHADDELIGCYQLIKTHKKAVKLFYCGFTGSNFSIENREIRLLEFEIFCKNFGVEYIISSAEIAVDLQKAITEYSPYTILLPSCIDWHSEHRQINYILKKILELTQIPHFLMWYHISVPMNSECVNLIISLSKQEQNIKWDNFSKYYMSQRYMPINRYKYLERISGYQYNCFAAEIFIVMRFEIWEKHLRVTQKPEVEDQLDNLYNNINNLLKSKKEADRIYRYYYI